MINSLESPGQVLLLQLSKEDLKAIIRDTFHELLKDIPFRTKQEDQKDLLKMDEVCDLLKVSRVTVHQWKKTGRIPFHRISNRVFFKKSEVMNSLNKIDLSNPLKSR
jgi:excisionase family DNA binding protein